MICNISDRHPRCNHTKPRIEGSELAQKRLEGRITYPSFLWSRRILERLQAVQNQKGSTMRDQFRQSFALLPRRSDPWIRVTKPTESSVKKFIGGRSASSAALLVERPAKNQLRRMIMFSSDQSQPMVDERGLADTSPGNDCNNIYPAGLPKHDPGKRYPPLDQKHRFL